MSLLLALLYVGDAIAIAAIVVFVRDFVRSGWWAL